MTQRDGFQQTFEHLWFALRSRWCRTHDLDGATVLSRFEVPDPFFHRVVQVDVSENEVDRLIDDVVSLFEGTDAQCAFTISDLDQPASLNRRLEDRGFERGTTASAMEFVGTPPDLDDKRSPIEVSTISDTDHAVWSKVMCTSFGLPTAVGTIAEGVLASQNANRYLAFLEDEPVGCGLLWSEFGMGYVDFIGTLADHRRKGVASAIVSHALRDSTANANRWTALEVVRGGSTERLYTKLGFVARHARHRFIAASDES